MPQVPLTVLGGFFLFGVLAVDLTVDLSANTAGIGYYYNMQRRAALPQVAFIPGGILLLVGGLIGDLLSSPKSVGNIIRSVIGTVPGVLFGGFLIPAQDFLAAQVDQKGKLSDTPEVLQAMELIRLGHIAIAGMVSLIVISRLLSSSSKSKGE